MLATTGRRRKKRHPSSALLHADGSVGDNLENIPVQPDILVPDVPEEALAGRDAQVEAGVAECLRMLTESRDR